MVRAPVQTEVGKKSAEENRNNIVKAFEVPDMIFITAGMGGGTGTGAVVVAEHSQGIGVILT
jgi:cell division protein FtsZ